jgi:bifunctional DNA-binding transcriptional regulator/antitoxin component of YhaV-PrlF toxin-antitoxin module
MSTSPKAEYTVKIAGKRQVTFPKEILEALNLDKGDEFQIVVHNPYDIRLVPYTRVRSDLITPEIEQILRKRRQEIADGAPVASLNTVVNRATLKDVQRGIQTRRLKAEAIARTLAAPSTISK